MSSRYARPGSPTGPGRRFQDPSRSSTGSVYSSNTYEMPSSYRHRDSFASPRTSGERVIPISSETYVNGQRVGSTAQPRPTYDAYDPRPRRSTYDDGPRAAPSNAGSSYLQPAVVNNASARGVSPATRPSNYDPGRYVSSSSSAAPKREHKKVYSVDDGKTTRLVPGAEKELVRKETVNNRLPPPPADRSRGDYHLSGPAKRTSTSEEATGYEYTDARGMYRDTEPKWRSRRGSVEGGRRERPSSMIEPYGNTRTTKDATREAGPPPSTRGFDRINTNLGRHGSVTGSVTSPSRQRERNVGSTSSGYSEDENYRVAPRILPAERQDDGYKMPSERGEVYSPVRGEFSGRRESRGLSRRFEDAEITSRGFGIRPPSVEPRRSRDDSIDRYSGYSADPYVKPLPRDYPRERDPVRDDPRRDSEYYEQERLRERELPRAKKESPPMREAGLPKERELPRDALPPREAPREYEALPPRDVLPSKERDAREVLPGRDELPQRQKEVARDREREAGLEEPRREREREFGPRERDIDPRTEDDRKAYNKRPEREYYDDRRPYDKRPERDYDNQRRIDDRLERSDDTTSQASGGSGAGLVGTAAVGAAAYGAKQLHDRRRPEDIKADRVERPRPEPRDVREVGSAVLPPVDSRRDERLPADRGVEREVDNRERGRFVDESPEDIDRARKRNYVGKDNAADDLRQPEPKQKHSEILDPEEDYRRRVQQEAERRQAPRFEEPHYDDEGPRERRRHDDSGNATRERDEPRERDDVDPLRHVDEESVSDHTRDAQALTPYKYPSDDLSESRYTGESDEMPSHKPRVSIVEPPKEKEKPKGILRKPTEKFPEHPNPIREGVAPLKDGKNKDVPSGARWTKINRSMVNPEALEEAQERFEERQEHVIVLRVLTKEDIQKFADRTKEIRGKFEGTSYC